MPDSSPSDRYKAEMPQIPGVNAPGKPPAGFLAGLSPAARLGGGIVLVVILIAGFLFLRSHSRAKNGDQAENEPAAQISVPAPANTATSPPGIVTETLPTIASVAELAEPWSSKQFSYRNRLTGESLPALIVRLPGGAASQGSNYWAFSLQAAYARCQLEYVTDLQKLASEYGFRAKHPMIGNPCSRSVFDPLRMANLPGNVWVRGAMVQGSDIRPPLGIEVKVEGNSVLALRME